MSKSKELGHLLDLICECLKKYAEVIKSLDSRIDILKEEVVGLQKGLSMLIERRAYEPEHGKWIHDDFGWHCSECWILYPGEITDELNFCPHCGAQMNTRDEDE